MKRFVLFYVVTVFLLSLESCWYRQCPVRGCKVRHNHSHGKRIVRGRGTIPTPFMFGMKRTKAEKRQQSSQKRR